MLCGGKGNISVTANLAPRKMHELCVAALAGDIATAMRIQFELMPLHKHLFVEPNPVPLKWAMARLGLCGPALRLPLVELGEGHRPTVESALRACGLLKD
jgi:4-hydroxy-tetrahydrodipicolinate synthase